MNTNNTVDVNMRSSTYLELMSIFDSDSASE